MPYVAVAHWTHSPLAVVFWLLIISWMVLTWR
jgi:hypothetical protein